MSRRAEYNLQFQKIESNGWSTYYDCIGTTSDGRSLFIANILRGHNDAGAPEAFINEIELAETGQFEEMDEFWQPDSLTDSFRCFITPPNIILGKNHNYTLPLLSFKELLQEWAAFLQQ
ncbi:hypothetical protein [Chryseobacterium sp. FH1]|uniref:hypothetical protein n=1 Tax=Chryseobacterium sp. FH1 TaxID=1233951 RepID=UPI0004E45CC6|nr:hypothetical protein [Chryseobacterium sp. FH1]KFC19673.1 hypothetical protein IO90_10395 [Chryseobacterium sp. FH1]